MVIKLFIEGNINNIANYGCRPTVIITDTKLIEREKPADEKTESFEWNDLKKNSKK